ncbi:MAG: histidine kinase [Saprospiraceae bacterium]|nr:histidine kinase [Saprospiraceae bacterium]MBK7736566.1 histidine kinase [Saprospiraceae bacterium]MBK7912070.1 histidine kinase [Saprospiraceae bacterium]
MSLHFPKPPRYQYIGFWISMPFISYSLCYILFGERLFSEWTIWLISYPIIYAIGYFSWRSHYIYDNYLISKYPGLDQTRTRVFLKLPINLLVMSPSVILIIYVFHFFHIQGYIIQQEDLKYALLVGLTVNVLFESLWEVIYIIEKYKEVIEEKEFIKQLQLQQEFDNLKQKVNPHFLFNCFNTLSSLISEDKDQAEKFLDELSKVYRYLLRNNESGMSTLEQEILFIQSFNKLLKTRFGQALDIQMEINPIYKDSQLPTLCLQLLIENVVKHNIVSRQMPMIVKIYTEPSGRIVVENKLQKKLHPVDSTGIGLSNIKEKYRLLNREDVLIEEGPAQFRVSLPLLD